MNDTTDTISRSPEDIMEAMRDVVDPELGINVVDLGLVYGVTLDDDGTAVLDMTLTSAACPLTDAPTAVSERQLKELNIRVRQAPTAG